MAQSKLLSAPVIVVPPRANRLVRALAEDSAAPATGDDGSVLAKVRQEPPPSAGFRRALFLAVSVVVGNPHTARDPAFAVEALDGSLLLRLVFSGGEVRVDDDTGAEVGVIVNEGLAGARDILLRVYGPGDTTSRRGLRTPRGELLAEGRAPQAQAPAITLADPAGTAVSRTAPLDDGRVRTEIMTQAPPLATLLAGFACSLVVPDWIDRPPTPGGGGAERSPRPVRHAARQLGSLAQQPPATEGAQIGMASEFLQRKIAGVFHAMDADSNGHLEEADFNAVTQRWAQLRGWEPGSDGYERMSSIMLGWWAGLLMADQDGDGQVDFDELMTLVDQLGSMDEEVYATADAMFEAIDENGDERVSLEEHKQVVQRVEGLRRRRRGRLPAAGPQRRRPPLARRVPRAVVGLLARRRPGLAVAVGVRPVLNLGSRSAAHLCPAERRPDGI